MKKTNTLKFYRYYKGEDENPFEDSTDAGIFWALEKQYDDIIQIDGEDYHNYWISYARNYIKENPNKKNPLTDEHISIDTKAIFFFIDTMITKWNPYDSQTSYRYLISI